MGESEIWCMHPRVKIPLKLDLLWMTDDFFLEIPKGDASD